MYFQIFMKVIVPVVIVISSFDVAEAMPTNTNSRIVREANLDAKLLHHFQSPSHLNGPSSYKHNPEDPILNHLDDALSDISTVYMHALFAGIQTAELELQMRRLEVKLFDLLDSLYKENRMKDYMYYESEVTRQMILYNMLKKLFGYAPTDEKE